MAFGGAADPAAAQRSLGAQLWLLGKGAGASLRARLAGRDCLLGANPELARPLPVTGGGLLQLAEVVFRPVATTGVPLEAGQQHARPRGCCARSRTRAAVRGGALPSSGVRSGAGRPREPTGVPLSGLAANDREHATPGWRCWAAELHLGWWFGFLRSLYLVTYHGPILTLLSLGFVPRGVFHFGVAFWAEERRGGAYFLRRGVVLVEDFMARTANGEEVLFGVLATTFTERLYVVDFPRLTYAAALTSLVPVQVSSTDLPPSLGRTVPFHGGSL